MATRPPPLLSIVTINLNDRDGLARTLASVASQSFADRELIVVDGGSTDGSVELIRASGALVSDWLSERDRGVYDAQNKGLARARGTFVLFLNSGDSLAAPDALERLLAGPPPRGSSTATRSSSTWAAGASRGRSRTGRPSSS